MASDARSRSPQDGGGGQRREVRSPYVTLGTVRYAVRHVPPPRACPCRCCSEEAVSACLGLAKADRRTLDRLHRTLGRSGREERPSRQKRLRDLTERLLRATTTPPPTPTPQQPPPRPIQPHSAPVLPPVPPPRVRHRHSPPRGVSVDRYDDFDANKITLVRVEPRSIIGSYAQKTIPYRSASFSHGDFAPEKYYKSANRQPSIFDFAKRSPIAETVALGVPNCDGESTSATEEHITEDGSLASVDSAVGSDEGLLAHASLAPRSLPPDAPHKQLGARSLTHPLPRRVPPVREEGPGEASGSLPALTAPRVLHELREESDGSQADSAQAHSEGTSPLEPVQPFDFPPLPAPPPNTCVNVDCECAKFPVTRDDSVTTIAKSIPVPVYECIVKQWSQELPQEEPQRLNAASDGSLDRDKEDETITSEQVANLLEAVKNPRTPAPIGARERRKPLDKTKRRKGIYITTASDDGGEDESPPSFNGCKRESSDASLQEMRLSAETRTSSLLGDKSDDSCTNGPPSPCEGPGPIWCRTEDLKSRRARFSQQSSDERDEDSYRTRRKYGVTSRGDSPSEAESDSCSQDRTASPSPYSPSDASDVEVRRQQFSKGPFGRILEAPAPRAVEGGRRSFSDATVPCRKTSAGGTPSSTTSALRGPTHVRATSSPSKLAGVKPGADLLAELLRGSSEALSNATTFDNVVLTLQQYSNSTGGDTDTRTHVVIELYETEKSYVESLEILVKKYLQQLKNPDNNILDPILVDEIFFEVPALLSVHENFLEMLIRRLDLWDKQQKIGDIFLEVFTNPNVLDTYISFVNNSKKARETIKHATASRPAFARFLDAMARDHKGKLSLDNLLIKPVQKFPSYKLIFARLLKHTPLAHPDYPYLDDCAKKVCNVLELINCTEKEMSDQEQQQLLIKDLEAAIEGLSSVALTDRTFIRYDTVTMPAGQGALKDRAVFLLSDTLFITTFKRRTGPIKKPTPSYSSNISTLLEGNKYKLLMKIPLSELEIIRSKDENLKRIISEVESLTEDVTILTRISEQVASIHVPHVQLDDMVKEMLANVNKQLSERQSSETQLCHLELSFNTPNGPEVATIIFPKADKKASFEEALSEAKQKLGPFGVERPAPEFLTVVPIRKTRAGLQFTCAAPTIPPKGQSPDVWVCNSDGYVGQVCVLTLSPTPQVTSCNGVCNSRILCIACIPPAPPLVRQQTLDIPSVTAMRVFSASKPGISVSDHDSCVSNILDSPSSSDEEDDRSSTSDNVDAQSERSQESGYARLQSSLTSSFSSHRSTLTPSHSKSLSTPHTGQNTPVHPVMKSNSNPAVDKQIVAMNSGALSSPTSRQCSEDSGGAVANQPTMWVGCEDGYIHVYNCMDNIRIKKNKIKLHHNSAVHSIVYVDGKVFVSLRNGNLVVYSRDLDGVWVERASLAVGTGGSPVGSMLLTGDKLWCATHAHIKMVNTQNLNVEEIFQITSESKPISEMVIAGSTIWVSLQNTVQIRCYNGSTREQLADINLTSQIIKMLSVFPGCDDIIRQHKTACLRVTALLAHEDTLWVGTSAGLLLTGPLHNSPNVRTGMFTAPIFTGVVHGHTGNIRFLTRVERTVLSPPSPKPSTSGAGKGKFSSRNSLNSDLLPKVDAQPKDKEILIISGGDGYEDLSKACSAEEAGREDSTNHLLLWRV